MLVKTCIRSRMDYVDRLSIQFKGYLAGMFASDANVGYTDLTVDDGELLAGAMISTISNVLQRETTLHVVQKMNHLFREVSFYRVGGADVISRNGELLYEPELSLTEREKATEVAALLDEVKRWHRELDDACDEVSGLPQDQHTNSNLRKAFLRHIDYHNTIGPPEDQLDFRALNVDVNPD